MVENKLIDIVYTKNGTLSVISQDNMLALRNGNVGYSCIYTDQSIYQPILKEVQEIIDVFHYNYNIDTALILGGGCCTIPRFMIKRFDNSVYIDSVEYMPEIIEITEKYFLKGLATDKLNIINGDAFRFINETENKYNVIFVDLFNGGRIVEKVMSESFIKNIHKHMEDEAVAIVNTFQCSTTERDEICKLGRKYFERCFCKLDEFGTNYIVFVNGDFKV